MFIWTSRTIYVCFRAIGCRAANSQEKKKRCENVNERSKTRKAQILFGSGVHLRSIPTYACARAHTQRIYYTTLIYGCARQFVVYFIFSCLRQFFSLRFYSSPRRKTFTYEHFWQFSHRIRVSLESSYLLLQIIIIICICRYTGIFTFHVPMRLFHTPTHPQTRLSGSFYEEFYSNITINK